MNPSPSRETYRIPENFLEPTFLTELALFVRAPALASVRRAVPPARHCDRAARPRHRARDDQRDRARLESGRGRRWDALFYGRNHVNIDTRSFR